MATWEDALAVYENRVKTGRNYSEEDSDVDGTIYAYVCPGCGLKTYATGEDMAERREHDGRCFVCIATAASPDDPQTPDYGAYPPGEEEVQA